MSNQQYDIESLNYRLFVQFRELFKESPAEAILRYGFSLQEGQRIMDLSHEQMNALASSGKLVFSVKLPKHWD